MGLRPGKCYRRIKRAYARIAITVPKKNFIGATPGLKTRQFNMGNPFKEFSRIVDLVADDHVQIRDNAMESCRIAINRYLEKNLGKEGYFMKIRVYPNQFLREKKQAQGAGADRVSQGMSHAFGKATGRAVQTRPGQVLMSVLVDEEKVGVAKTALMRANAKMPLRVYTEVSADVGSIGTKPKKMRAVEEEKAAEAEAAAPATEAGEAKAEKKDEAKPGAKADKKAETKPEAKKEAAKKK